MGKYFLFYQMQHQQFAYIYTQRKTMVLRTFWNQGVVIGGGGGGVTHIKWSGMLIGNYI